MGRERCPARVIRSNNCSGEQRAQRLLHPQRVVWPNSADSHVCQCGPSWIKWSNRSSCYNSSVICRQRTTAWINRRCRRWPAWLWRRISGSRYRQPARFDWTEAVRGDGTSRLDCTPRLGDKVPDGALTQQTFKWCIFKTSRQKGLKAKLEELPDQDQY